MASIHFRNLQVVSDDEYRGDHDEYHDEYRVLLLTHLRLYCMV